MSQPALALSPSFPADPKALTYQVAGVARKGGTTLTDAPVRAFRQDGGGLAGETVTSAAGIFRIFFRGYPGLLTLLVYDPSDVKTNAKVFTDVDPVEVPHQPWTYSGSWSGMGSWAQLVPDTGIVLNTVESSLLQPKRSWRQMGSWKFPNTWGGTSSHVSTETSGLFDKRKWRDFSRWGDFGNWLGYGSASHPSSLKLRWTDYPNWRAMVTWRSSTQG